MRKRLIDKSSRFRSFLCFAIIVFVCNSIYLQSVYAQQTEEQNEKKVVAESSENNSESMSQALDESLYQYEQPESEDVSYGWMIFRALFIIALLVLGFYLFIRYLTRQGAVQVAGAGVASTISIMPLGQNRQLHIIELGTKVLVLGVCDGGVNLIKEVSDRDEIDRIKLQSSRSSAMPGTGFQQFLKNQIEQIADKVSKGTSARRVISKPSPLKAPVKDNFEEMVASSVADEKQSGERSFFDDDRIDYMRKQRTRLREINRYNDED